MRTIILAGLAAVTLGACSGRNAQPIRDFGAATINAFERDVVIHKELSLPASFNTLPQPVVGAPNRADP